MTLSEKLKVASSFSSHNNMYKKFFIFVFAILIISAPYYVADAAGLVPNCNTGTSVNSTQTGLGTPCNFDQLVLLINQIITFLLKVIATPLAAVALCYAGFLLISSGGSQENITKAKHIIRNVIVGYIIALAAWLIVKTIITTLGVDPSIDTFLK